MPEAPLQRSYGCSYGCGNPYDYVIVSVADSTTELLCLPCFLRLAEVVLDAVTHPEADEVRNAVEAAGQVEQTRMNGQGPKARGKNAPANTDDPNLIEAFDSVMTVEDLPEEFR